MRRGVTVLVVVVVAAISLAAGLDALRGEDSPRAGSEPEPETPSVSTTEPEGPTNYVPLEDRFAGTLYYTDASCELRAIELPRQTPAEAPNWDECRFVLSPNGRRVSGEGSGWDPHSDPLIGKLFQSEDGMIQVSTNRGPEGEPFRGTAPAWRPDGTLTFFADGAYREWPDGEVILSQTEIVTELRSHRYEVVRASVKEAAWMSEERLALIAALERQTEPDQDVVLFFEQRRLTGVGGGASGVLSDLRASPQGNLVTVRSLPSFELLTHEGGHPGVPPLVGVRATAFSPDGRWIAAATDAGVYLFRTGREQWAARLDLDADDLAWRGQAGPPPLAGASGARDWLGDARATGRLFVTDSDCRLRALRLPSLTWEDEPDDMPAPCRFSLTSTDLAVDETVALQPQGELGAYCEGDALEVYTMGASDETFFANACAPAWMPDGRLTFIRGGELFAGEADGDERLLISRDDLREMFGRGVALEEVAWVDDERFWAVVRSGETAIVALMTTDRLVSSPSFTTRTIEGLRVSATGMVAARTDKGIVFFDSGGRRALTFPNGQAVAWAPGELIAAVATPSEVLFVAPVSGEIVTLPLAVRDLEWVVP